MALSPDQYENQEFTVAWRGWKKEEVTAFLKARATDLRELQAKLDAAKAEVEEAKRSKEAAIAAAAQLPVPPALAPTPEQSDADKFNEMGDRIAGLLRVAEESAEKIRNEAEVEADEMTTLAGIEAEELKVEAQRILDEAKEEAARIRAEADTSVADIRSELEEARANLDAELAETRRQTEADREQAAKELAEAKAEVADLLAKARSQSEFIRHEADEIVRVKVRTDMETAEKRMRILQLTEQSSRDRLVAAQSELNAALEKLEAEPAPELDSVQADNVLEEAHDRAARELASGGSTRAAAATLAGGNSLDEVFEPQFYENPDPVAADDIEDTDEADDADQMVDDTADTDDTADAENTADADEAIEVDEVTDPVEDDASLEADDEADAGDDDTVDADITDDADADETALLDTADEDDSFGSKYEEAYGFTSETEVASDDETDDAVAEDADDDDVAEDVAAADASDEADDAEDVLDAQSVMDSTPGVVIEDSISSLPEDDQSPLGSVEVPNDSGKLVDSELVPTAAVNEVPAALAGKPSGGQAEADTKPLADEDPLAKLVREAMQRAVDSARGDEG